VLAMIGASEMMNAIKPTAQPCSYPHENQRGDGNDRHCLQQQRIRIEHPPHPARLRKEKRNDHTEENTSDETSGGFRCRNCEGRRE